MNELCEIWQLRGTITTDYCQFETQEGSHSIILKIARDTALSVRIMFRFMIFFPSLGLNFIF